MTDSRLTKFITQVAFDELEARVSAVEQVLGVDTNELDPLEARHLAIVAPRAKKFLESAESD